MAAYLCLCVIWGTTWSVIQIGLEGIPPFTGVSLRFGIAGALLWMLARVRGVRLGALPRERRLWWINATLAFGVSYGVVYWAEQWVPSGLTAVLFATYPLFLALLSHFLLPAERLGPAEILGVLVGFVGVGVIFSTDFDELGGSWVAVASAVLLLSPLAAALASIFVKRWGAGVHPLSLSAVPMLMTAAVLGGPAFALEHQRTFVWNATSVAALLYLALFGSAVTFTLYYWLLARMPAKRLGLIAYVIPVVAVALGTLRGERLTWVTLAGSTLVVGGVALAMQRPRKREQIVETD